MVLWASKSHNVQHGPLSSGKSPGVLTRGQVRCSTELRCPFWWPALKGNVNVHIAKTPCDAHVGRGEDPALRVTRKATEENTECHKEIVTTTKRALGEQPAGRLRRPRTVAVQLSSSQLPLGPSLLGPLQGSS